MKYLLPFTLALAIPSAVSAGGCYEATAIRDFETYLSGGMTTQEALSAIREDGNFDGSRKCFIKLKGWTNRVRITHPYSYRALWGE